MFTYSMSLTAETEADSEECAIKGQEQLASDLGQAGGAETWRDVTSFTCTWEASPSTFVPPLSMYLLRGRLNEPGSWCEGGGVAAKPAAGGRIRTAERNNTVHPQGGHSGLILLVNLQLTNKTSTFIV